MGGSLLLSPMNIILIFFLSIGIRDVHFIRNIRYFYQWLIQRYRHRIINDLRLCVLLLYLKSGRIYNRTRMNNFIVTLTSPKAQ